MSKPGGVESKGCTCGNKYNSHEKPLCKEHMMNPDQRIFKWLYPDVCWHDLIDRPLEDYLEVDRDKGCKDIICRTCCDAMPSNPDYSRPSGFVELMKELLGRGIIIIQDKKGDTYTTTLATYSTTKPEYQSHSTTPELALRDAVVKLVEGEEGGMKLIILCLVVVFSSLWGGSYLLHRVGWESWIRFPIFMSLSLITIVGLVIAVAVCVEKFGD